MDYPLLIKNVSVFVRTLFDRQAGPALLYHNYVHTLNVVERVIIIGRHYRLKRREDFILEAAAWFHDCGQLMGNGQDHEELSASIMKEFFGPVGLPADMLAQIEGCILATKIPHKPASFLDEIICDADTYNLGTDEFPATDELLKRECELRGLPTKNWDRNTLDFLLRHRYFTAYCRQMLDGTKEKNIAFVREKLKNTSSAGK